MTAIQFNATPYNIGSWSVLLLPREASAKLPSRGMVMVEGTINGYDFQAPLEPDGRGSHWLNLDKELRDATGVGAGDDLALNISPSKAWPEPKIPTDLQKALNDAPEVKPLWEDITPMARWDWIRWISSTGKDETRKKRIQVAFSKLKAGSRRPCCFNRALCTVPAVSKGGALLEPASSTTPQ